MKNNSLWPGWGKWVLIGVLAILLFVLLVIFDPTSPNKLFNPQESESAVQQTELIPYTPTRKKMIEGTSTLPWMITGPAKGSLSIVEFTDFTCPYSHASFPSLNVIKNKYAKDTRLVLRTYAADNRSIALALAGHCAGEQGRYWEMANILFDNQNDTLGNDIEELVGFANQLRLDSVKFRQCLVSKKYLDNITTDIRDAVDALKIPGTPTWYFNGQAVSNALTADQLSQIIESIPK
ncbi:MAG: thioredoxin domain-containing protein [Candidatus Falkowbacteria bacterium]